MNTYERNIHYSKEIRAIYKKENKHVNDKEVFIQGM